MIQKIIEWIKKNKILFFLFLISFILINYAFAAAFLKLANNNSIILKYVYPQGIIWFGSFQNLFLFFLTALIIFLINFLLAKKFGEYDYIWGVFIAVLNFFVCLLIFLYFMSIMWIN